MAKSMEARKCEACFRGREKRQGWNRVGVPAESRVMNVEKVRRPRRPGSEVWNVFLETRSSILRQMTCPDYAGWIRDRMGGREN